MTSRSIDRRSVRNMRCWPAVTLVVLVSISGCAQDVPPASSGDAGENAPEPIPRIEPESPGADFDPTHIIASETEYYTSGPQQARPADGTFATGTRVELVENAGSYSLVRSDSKIEGYVSASALKPIKDTTSEAPSSP